MSLFLGRSQKKKKKAMKQQKIGVLTAMKTVRRLHHFRKYFSPSSAKHYFHSEKFNGLTFSANLV